MDLDPLVALFASKKDLFNHPSLAVKWVASEEHAVLCMLTFLPFGDSIVPQPLLVAIIMMHECSSYRYEERAITVVMIHSRRVLMMH